MCMRFSDGYTEVHRLLAGSAPNSATMSLYSLILPTYNERENLPLIVYMINKAFTDMLVLCQLLEPPQDALTHLSRGFALQRGEVRVGHR